MQKDAFGLLFRTILVPICLNVFQNISSCLICDIPQTVWNLADQCTFVVKLQQCAEKTLIWVPVCAGIHYVAAAHSNGLWSFTEVHRKSAQLHLVKTAMKRYFLLFSHNFSQIGQGTLHLDLRYCSLQNDRVTDYTIYTVWTVMPTLLWPNLYW